MTDSRPCELRRSWALGSESGKKFTDLRHSLRFMQLTKPNSVELEGNQERVERKIIESQGISLRIIVWLGKDHRVQNERVVKDT